MNAPRNWAGNIAFRAARVHRPSTVDELRRVVAGSRRIRPLGTAHSFNRIADCADDMVSVAGLPPILSGAVGATVAVAVYAFAWFAGIRWLTGYQPGKGS